jgi:hypothetical protein
VVISDQTRERSCQIAAKPLSSRQRTMKAPLSRRCHDSVSGLPFRCHANERPIGRVPANYHYEISFLTFAE